MQSTLIVLCCLLQNEHKKQNFGAVVANRIDRPDSRWYILFMSLRKLYRWSMYGTKTDIDIQGKEGRVSLASA